MPVSSNLSKNLNSRFIYKRVQDLHLETELKRESKILPCTAQIRPLSEHKTNGHRFILSIKREIENGGFKGTYSIHGGADGSEVPSVLDTHGEDIQ